MVQGQLQRYLTANNAMPQHQSAYRLYHSTETALIKITNDLLQTADHGLVSPLCMLDLTASLLLSTRSITVYFCHAYKDDSVSKAYA